MAIPVFFTAELIPYHEVTGDVINEAAIALATELRDFFADKADFVINTTGEAGVGTTYDISASNPSLRMVITSLVGGFRGVTEDEAITLAQTFTSERFPHTTASLDEASIVAHPTESSNEGAAAPSA